MFDASEHEYCSESDTDWVAHVQAKHSTGGVASQL